MVLTTSYNYSSWGESKPTYNWGAHCADDEGCGVGLKVVCLPVMFVGQKTYSSAFWGWRWLWVDVLTKFHDLTVIFQFRV